MANETIKWGVEVLSCIRWASIYPHLRESMEEIVSIGLAVLASVRSHHGQFCAQPAGERSEPD